MSSLGVSKKKRTYRSCTGCRSAKTKCDGDRPACSRCQSRSIPCAYNASAVPLWARVLSNEESPRENGSSNEPGQSAAGGSSTADNEASESPVNPERSTSADPPMQEHVSTAALPSSPLEISSFGNYSPDSGSRSTHLSWYDVLSGIPETLSICPVLLTHARVLKAVVSQTSNSAVSSQGPGGALLQQHSPPPLFCLRPQTFVHAAAGSWPRFQSR